MMASSQFMSLSHKNAPVEIKSTGTEEEHQNMCIATAMELYCAKDVLVWPMICPVFVESNFPCRYMNRSDFIQIVQEKLPGLSRLAQSDAQLGTFGMQNCSKCSGDSSSEKSGCNTRWFVPAAIIILVCSFDMPLGFCRKRYECMQAGSGTKNMLIEVQGCILYNIRHGRRNW